jgi:excisionase family DNA binding protein
MQIIAPMDWPAPLTLEEVAAELGCSESDVRALVREGELRTVACGIRPGLVPRHRLDDYLRRRGPAFRPGHAGYPGCMLRFRITHALGQRLWIIPSLGVVVGIVLSLITVAIDRHHQNGLLSQSIVGNGTDAQSILTSLATAVVTLTSMVLTVTLVAVQLAMGQFSPRIVRALLGDRGDQFAIAVFAATFTFSIYSLRAVDTGPGGAAVPGVTVLTALALAVASSSSTTRGSSCASARSSISSATSCGANSSTSSRRGPSARRIPPCCWRAAPATSSTATAMPLPPRPGGPGAPSSSCR